MEQVKIVVAMNAFKGSMSSVLASSMVADGFSKGFREARVITVPMADFISDAVDLTTLIEDASLVITGEGRVDSQTAMGKVPCAVASLASDLGIPVLVIGGAIGSDLVCGFPPEFTALFDCAIRPMTVSEAVSEGPENLRFVSEQIGRTARAFALLRVTRKDVCAGGIVVRQNPETGGREVLLVADRYGMVAPPKGHVEPGESTAQAAAREVREETGISVDLRAPLGSIRYRFPQDGGVTEKMVHYFLMEAIGGGLTPQDGETLDAFWVKETDLPGLNTYRETHIVLKRALEAFERMG
jgi:8-oxo-dGTP pyrophosphatase MutT (NUDIX family)